MVLTQCCLVEGSSFRDFSLYVHLATHNAYNHHHHHYHHHHHFICPVIQTEGGSVAKWLARSRAWVLIAASMLSGNSLRQTVHTHRAFVHQTAKLVAALLRVARVTAGLAESNGSLTPDL